MFDLKRVLAVNPLHAFIMDHWLWVVVLIIIASHVGVR